ncbi:MAG: bacterioferritin-associated ferredoxin [Betaproteobacteria bacterium]
MKLSYQPLVPLASHQKPHVQYESFAFTFVSALNNHYTHMYICICNAVTEKDIRFAVESGCDSFRRVRNELGVATTCGQCKKDACRVIREHKEEISCMRAMVGAD